MSVFRIDIDKETKELLEEFVKELGVLNEHLADVKTMIAPLLGFKIIGSKRNGLNG